MSKYIDPRSALMLLGDRTGFFPQEYREAAREIVEKHGTDKQKELAAKCMTVAMDRGELTRTTERPNI